MHVPLLVLCMQQMHTARSGTVHGLLVEGPDFDLLPRKADKNMRAFASATTLDH
jgi:hypothetical protein